jgi:hypothetical protein
MSRQKGPLSDGDSEIPSALAFKAVASPLNVVAARAKPAGGLKARITLGQIAFVAFFSC